MKTSIIILYLCTLLLLQGCTKESSISDLSIDVETDINNIEDPSVEAEIDVPSDTMYTLSFPHGDWEISVQPEQEIVQLKNPQGIEYRYSLSEISWDAASERQPQMDIDEKIHVLGASRGSGTTYRDHAYFLEQIDDTHIDLVCQAKEYSAGHMEPETGVVEFRYRFICVADAWYLDS